MTRRLWRLVWHYAVYAIGFAVLFAAVCVTLVRLLLPDIGIYRGKVEAWVSRYMGYPVAIHSLNATWYGWIPHLHLTNIDLLNEAGTKSITHFESADIRIDPLATIARRAFIPRELTVSGFRLSVQRKTDGSISIEGIDVGEMQADQAGDNELATWLLRQKTLRIENATVTWIDSMLGQEPVVLSDVALTLRSDGDRLQVEGSAQLPRSYGNRLDFAFDASGDVLTSKWSGQLYLAASDVNPDHWYRRYRPLNMNIAGGSADIKVWSTWDEAALTGLDGDLQYRDFAALIGSTKLRVERMGYGFSGRRTAGGGWSLDMRLHDLVTENGLWPAANVHVRAEPANGGPALRYEVSFDYLKLDDLVPLVSQLDFVPDSVREAMGRLDLGGEVRNGTLRFDPDFPTERQFSYDAKVSGLSTRFGTGRAALANASGHVTGTLEHGRIRFDGDTSDLLLPAYGIPRLELHALRGDLDWTRDASGWSLASDRLEFSSPDFDGSVAGSVAKGAGDSSPQLDLVAEVGPGNVEALSRYVPESPEFHLREWLARAALSGRLTGARAVLRGRLSDFPFDERNGRFQALVDAENIVLDYSDRWPPVDDLGTEIHFDGRHMHADLRGGKIFDADVERGTADIPDLLSPQKSVVIAGRVSGDIADLARFIEQSPLDHDPILNHLRGALSGGDMALDLGLDLPIHDPERPPGITGRIELSGSRLDSHIGDFALENIRGSVDFTRTDVHGGDLSAAFYGHPVNVAVSGSKTDPENPPSLAVYGTADEPFVVDRLVAAFPSLAVARGALLGRLHGSTDWRLNVGFLQDPQSHALRHRLDLHSSLAGMRIDLPRPLGKAADEDVPLSVTREIGPGATPDIAVGYGDRLSANIALPDAAAHTAAGAHLQFGGTGTPSRKEGGVYLSGLLDELPVDDWLRVFRPDAQAAHGVPDLHLLSADLKVASLGLLNQNFEDVTVAADGSAAGWTAHLDGPGIAGEIALSPAQDDGPGRIDLRLDRLQIAKIAPHDGDRLDPRTLPFLDVDVGEMHYDDKDLGQLRLQSSPLSDGVSIDHFAFEKPDLDVSGKGTWTRADAGDQSAFKITVHAKSIDSMLQTFGYNVAAFNHGETELAIDAGWAGAPADFSLERLNGTLDMRIRKGQLLDVEPKAGRLFGLLSIQTLPRRLSLDFSDLFGKGLAFDTIDGTFSISDGNAYTNDLHLAGPSADVIVTGRTGLADQDYDQIVTVTPQIANTLPVASALFGGPVGMGVGAVLYVAGEMFKSLHEGIDKLLRYQYTITGRWDAPVIEKFESNPQANG